MSKKTAKQKLLARVAAIHSRIQASADEDLAAWAAKLDAEEANAKLKSEADAAKATEAEIGTRSTGVPAAEAADGQNARANANWPSDFSGSMKAASRMVMLARRDAKTAASMLSMARRMRKGADELDIDDEECVGCTAASKLVKMAMKRTKSASSMMKMARKLVRADDAEEVDVEEIEASDTKSKVAARLVTLAKSMMADDDDEDDDCTASDKKAGEVPPQFKENIEKMKDKAKDKEASGNAKVAEALVQLAKSLGVDDEDEDDAEAEPVEASSK